MPDHGLGRLVVPDPRDAGYPLRTLLEAAPPQPLPTARQWVTGPILDQGQKPQCVGYGCRDWLSAAPNSDHRRSPAPSTLYRMAQQRDGIAGKHDGSTVRAGLQALQDLKRVASYHWAASIDDVVQWLLGHGPVILGVSWYEAMFEPDANGLIRIGGSVAGGHCLLAVGVDTIARTATLQQSWGVSWGRHGLCDISLDDLARLLREDGEAAAALEHAA